MFLLNKAGIVCLDGENDVCVQQQKHKIPSNAVYVEGRSEEPSYVMLLNALQPSDPYQQCYETLTCECVRKEQR